MTKKIKIEMPKDTGPVVYDGTPPMWSDKEIEKISAIKKNFGFFESYPLEEAFGQLRGNVIEIEMLASRKPNPADTQKYLDTLEKSGCFLLELIESAGTEHRSLVAAHVAGGVQTLSLLYKALGDVLKGLPAAKRAMREIQVKEPYKGGRPKKYNNKAIVWNLANIYEGGTGKKPTCWPLSKKPAKKSPELCVSHGGEFYEFCLKARSLLRRVEGIRLAESNSRLADIVSEILDERKSRKKISEHP